MKIKKRSYVLLELLLAITLSSFLLTSLGFWMIFTKKEKKANRQLYSWVLEENRAYKKIKFIVENMKKDFEISFLEENPICSFIFDRGIVSKPNLSNHVRGTLIFQREQGVLVLRIEENEDREEREFEELLLLDNVVSITYTPFCNLTIEDPLPEGIKIVIKRAVKSNFPERFLEWHCVRSD